MGSTRTLDCKPFKKNHDDQLKLVNSFHWLNLDQLEGIEDDIRQLFLDSFYIDETRRERIIEILQVRIEKLRGYVKMHQKNYDDIKADVRENIAYSGKWMTL